MSAFLRDRAFDQKDARAAVHRFSIGCVFGWVPLLTWLCNLALIAIAGTTLWAVGARVANM